VARLGRTVVTGPASPERPAQGSAGNLATELATRLEAFAPSALDPVEAEELGALRAMAARLAELAVCPHLVQSAAIDRATFDGLVALAGARVAPDLLRQLALDLRRVASGLAVALPALDWAELRAQTHVLTALAGSIGADRLAAMARELNETARVATPAPAAELGKRIAADLTAVIAFVELEGALIARPVEPS
jgi:hypothetical protein